MPVENPWKLDEIVRKRRNTRLLNSLHTGRVTGSIPVAPFAWFSGLAQTIRMSALGNLRTRGHFEFRDQIPRTSIPTHCGICACDSRRSFCAESAPENWVF